MTGLGIQSWVLMLLGIRSAFAHQEIATVLDIIHALGSSYRSASSGVVSGVAYGRIALIFCRTASLSILANLVSREAVVQTTLRAFGR
jgi:hypothetical protein